MYKSMTLWELLSCFFFVFLNIRLFIALYTPSTTIVLQISFATPAVPHSNKCLCTSNHKLTLCPLASLLRTRDCTDFKPV